jgi:hypothetical protein
MQRTPLSTVIASALIAIAAAGQAFASETNAPVTREQVQSDLAEARRSGNIVDAESGLKLNQAFPSRYPAQVAEQGKTRAQVMAELAEARRTGDIVDPETQQKLNKIFPSRYPTHAAPATSAGTRVSQR